MKTTQYINRSVPAELDPKIILSYTLGNLWENNMSTIIGLKELRTHADDVIERVAKGERFTVVRRTKPVFELGPVSETAVQTNQEVTDWTRQFVSRYRKTFEALADK